MKNKKAVDNLMENLVYFLLVVIFIALLLFAVTRVGSQATIYEQTYAKQISLIINKARPGMIIEVDMFDAYNLAKRNDYGGQIVSIDNEMNNPTFGSFTS